ncbi:formimidoylglutamase [Halorarius litoreus]|uniref:formimidoylglutamase n=1 Tax=Halorarius litoreus TaxID=2962676 RepID=UPI0020CD7FB2|nr:formimidoylglutamase [Halorarius litoreus]
MTGLTSAPSWSGTSSDPNDEQFGDVVEPVENVRGDGHEYDAVLVGEPFDRAVIGRKGAAQGPHGIREALAGLKTHHFDAGPVGRIGDAGDAFVAVDSGDDLPESVRDLQDHLRTVAGYLHDARTFPVFLGGDNSLTYPNVVPLLDQGSVGVVNLDAHLDVREPRDDASSGTPYRQLLDAGLDAYACVGARHFETSTRYHDYVREHGGDVVTSEEVGEDVVAAADRALDAMDDVEQVYLSLDCDVLDATAAPGVSAPTPGGLSTRECFRLLRLLASDPRVVGFEVVECAPPLDSGGVTVAAAARAVAHVLSARGARAEP